jgi:hypothetical protein
LHANSKKCFAETGGVPLLLRFLEKPNLNMKVKATAILVDLTMEHGMTFLLCDDKTPMEACKLVEAIMGILTFCELPIAKNVMKVLLSLTEASDDSDVVELIQDNNNNLQTIQAFIKMAKPPLQHQAIQLVFSMCKNNPSTMSIVEQDDDCLKVLLHEIENERPFDGSVKVAATGILSYIRLSENNLNKLMATENVLPALVKIVCGENMEGQANALGKQSLNSKVLLAGTMSSTWKCSKGQSKSL